MGNQTLPTPHLLSRRSLSLVDEVRNLLCRFIRFAEIGVDARAGDREAAICSVAPMPSYYLSQLFPHVTFFDFSKPCCFSRA